MEEKNVSHFVDTLIDSCIILNDTSFNFEYEFIFQWKWKYTVTRLNVDGPYYDGIQGYNVFKIRRIGVNSPNIPHDVLTVLAKGQYRLCKLQLNDMSLYAYSLKQFAANTRISDITKFSMKHPTGEFLNLNEDYQYASINPSGEVCILIDTQLYAINLKNRKKYQIPLREGFDISAAVPQMENNVSGDYNLSGKYLNVEWQSNLNGVVSWKDVNSKVQLKKQFSIKKFIID